MSFPSRLLFHPTVDCPRVEDIVVDGDLSDWAGISPLPPLCALDGQQPFAEVRIAWSTKGLYVAISTERDEPVAVSRQRPHSADSLQLWIDTRGSTSGRRATRFCHHFILLPSGGGPSRREPIGWQERIRRALDQGSMAAPDDLVVAARHDGQVYTLEALLPAEALHGFEPEAGQLIGFTYLITDLVRGRQTYACSDAFPYPHNPETWSRLRLA